MYSFLVHHILPMGHGAAWLPVKFKACTAGSIRNRPVVNLDPTTLLIRQLRLLNVNPKIIWLLCDLQLAGMISDRNDDDDDDDTNNYCTLYYS